MGHLNPHRPQQPLTPSQAKPQRSSHEETKESSHNQQGNRSGGLEDREIHDSGHSGKSTRR